MLPILRESKLKYKTFPSPHCFQDHLEKFRQQFEKKGRGSIEIQTQIKDINDLVCCEVSFNFYVQGL